METEAGRSRGGRLRPRACSARTSTCKPSVSGRPSLIIQLLRRPSPCGGAHLDPAFARRRRGATGDALATAGGAELILIEARDAAHRADELRDDGTNDLLVSEVVQTNELQTWFVTEHLVDVPLVKT